MNENKNMMRYAAIYSMIISLLKKGKIEREEAEEINNCCAAQLECDAITID